MSMKRIKSSGGYSTNSTITSTKRQNISFEYCGKLLNKKSKSHHKESDACVPFKNKHDADDAALCLISLSSNASSGNN